MVKCIERLFCKIGVNFSYLAEAALWVFVALGVAKLIVNGVDGVSSMAIASVIVFALIAFAFYFLAFSCRIIRTILDNREE